MAYRTFIARAADGLPLLEAQGEAGFGSGGSTAARQQASQLLSQLHHMTPWCSVDVAGGFVCHLRLLDGVCYMGLFCHSYPRNAAFVFLEDVIGAFQEELKREFGIGSVDYRSHIDTILKPYYFSRFDRHVGRIYTQFRDPSSSFVLAKLQQADLAKISFAMRCSINELMARGDSLANSIGDKANDDLSSKELPSRGRSSGKFCAFLLLLVGVVVLGVLFASDFYDWAPAVACIVLSFYLLKVCYSCLSGRRRVAAKKAADKLMAFAGDCGLGGEHLHLL